MDVRFTILGETGVHVGDFAEQPQLGPKPRALLSALLVRPGSPASVAELVDWIWGDVDELPDDPLRTLYTYSSRIRREFERFSIATRICVQNWNFRLDADPLAVDYYQFQDQVRRARAHSRRRDHQRALDVVTTALGMWGHRPLADLHTEAAQRWRESAWKNVYLPALDTMFFEQLALGESDAVLAKLDELAPEYPTHLQLFKRRLEALHHQSRTDEATQHFLVVHKALTADADEVAARELREFHDRLRERGAAPVEVPTDAGVLVPNQLPHDVPLFVGHEGLLLKLDKVAEQPGLITVEGAGGVGKTAFVVHWAHRNRFPGGVLFVDLQGFADGPIVEHGSVVDRFLEALGVAADRIAAADHRAAKLQSLLTGREVLVVLDNARDSDHVRPLLPLLSGCVVVVTSRTRLSGLAVRQSVYPFPIAPLAPALSVRLLAGHIGDRARDQHDVLAGLARLCGGLPLALMVLAQYVAVRPEVPLADFLSELNRDVRLLDIGLGGDGANYGPRAVFAQSVRALDEHPRQLFRLLGAHPGPDFGVDVAAALSGLPARRARLVLDTLVEAHLLEQPRSLGRFKFHDLLREYAADLIDAAHERHDVEQRLLAFYLRSAEAADKLVFPTQARAHTTTAEGVGVEFTDEASARMWCIGERRNICAIVRRAVESGHHQLAAEMPQLTGQILLRHGFFEDALELLHLGVAAAIACADVEGEADAYHNIATTHLLRQEFRLAEQYVHQAHLKFASIADEIGIAACLHTGARIMVETGNVLIGIDSHERALRMIRRTGQTGMEAVFLYRAGEAYQAATEYERAAAYYRESLTLARNSDDVACTGRALSLLGSLAFARERTAEARDYLCAALRHLEAVYDLGTAGTTCGLLSRVEEECGRVFEATQYARQAIRLCRRASDSRGEAEALTTLGRIFAATARYDGAVEAWERAKAIYDDLAPAQAAELAVALRELPSAILELPVARDGDETDSIVNEPNRR